MRRFAAVILVDPHGRLLLQERDEHPELDPEKWGLVGGHLDGDESFAEAAVRELEEETEVVLTGDDLGFWQEFEIDHTETHGTRDRMQVFVAGCDLANEDVVCHEGRQIVFVDPDVAPGLDLSAAASEIVPAFLQSDTYAGLTGGRSPSTGRFA